MKLLSIICAKIALFLLERKNRGGSYPGMLAFRICPTILGRLKIRGEVILVTGTNGKTSTANLFADSLKEANKYVIHNTKGDNMKNGILSCLIKHADWRGHVDCDMVVLEVDELSMPFIMQHLHVHDIIITNFFRDQLDRASEMEQLIHIVLHSLKNFHGNLILNGHDPHTVRFYKELTKAQSFFYGVSPQAQEHIEEVKEGVFCPICAHALHYDSIQYSHIGEFHCEHCDFKTPRTILLANDVQGKEFHVHFDTFTAPVDSLYMIYNCMAVISLFEVLHLEKQSVKAAFLKFRMPMGRNEVLQIKEHQVILHLVKNPTGMNEVLKQIEKEKRNHSVLFVLNDAPQDGTDISWIYDADFERLFHAHTTSITTSGARAYEAGLRMRYGGYDSELFVYEDMQEAWQQVVHRETVIYVLATYTALLPMRKIIGGTTL